MYRWSCYKPVKSSCELYWHISFLAAYPIFQIQHFTNLTFHLLFLKTTYITFFSGSINVSSIFLVSQSKTVNPFRKSHPFYLQNYLEYSPFWQFSQLSQKKPFRVQCNVFLSAMLTSFFVPLWSLLLR